MFKRSLASCVVAAALSTATIVPAHAVSVTVSKDQCMLTFAPADFVSGAQKYPYSQEAAKGELKERQDELDKLQAALERREALADAGEKPDGTNEYDELTISGLKARVTRSRAWVVGLKSCAEGKGMTQLDDDTNKALSSIDGKPNGAGIGVIIAGVVVGVVGIGVATFLAMAPMLPPQVRDMLPPQLRAVLHV